MRKLLLGSTAVAAAALFAPSGANAQGADPFLPAGPPMVSHRALEVRVGGYIRTQYNYTDQDFASQNGVAIGKSDFATDAEIHVVANGKAANGLRYGVAIELQTDFNNSNAVQSKTTVDTDEMWMFVAGNFGQIRFGDEDGVIGGLMNSGHVTNFASGGIDGDWFDSVIGPTRAGYTNPGDLGDASKIIYLSPQFFGFDVGASFAFNANEGEDAGCSGTSNTASALCDRAFGVVGATTTRRRNEFQLAARWRGSFGGVGLAVTAGGMLSDAIKTLPTAGIVGQRVEQVRVGVIGAQASAFGFLVGGHFTYGQAGAGMSPIYSRNSTIQNGATIIDDRNLSQYFVGASYTIDALTVGANYINAVTAGSQTAAGGRRDWAWSVGATYRLAPGLELIAEYTHVQRKEGGFNFATGTTNTTAATYGLNNKTEADVFLLGTRIAF